MPPYWPALCTLLWLAALLVLIIRFQFNSFVALLVVSIGLGISSGLSPVAVLDACNKGVGDILKGVGAVLVLGAMLGRILEISGAAEVVARTLIRTFGEKQAPVAILLAAYLIGIPMVFNVGFLLLIPIMWRLQRETGKSLLYFVLPLNFSLTIPHSLVPPHPGIVGCVQALKGNLLETMLAGTLLGIPLVLMGWFGPGLWWARNSHILPPENLEAETPPEEKRSLPEFVQSLLIILLPLLLSCLGFLADFQVIRHHWEDQLGESLAGIWDWLRFLGHPTMALMIPTGLGFWLLGGRRGMGSAELAKVAGNAVQDVGGMALLFGAAGAFKEVIEVTGAGKFIALWASQLPFSPIIVCYVVAMLIRIALGSATASILTASGILAALADQYPEMRTQLILAIAIGVTFMTQPADSGFWLVKEYCNMSVRDIFLKFNPCRMFMSIIGLLLLLAWQSLRGSASG